MDDLSSKIIDLLEKKGGFLPLNDKSSPEAILMLSVQVKARTKDHRRFVQAR